MKPDLVDRLIQHTVFLQVISPTLTYMFFGGSEINEPVLVIVKHLAVSIRTNTVLLVRNDEPHAPPITVQCSLTLFFVYTCLIITCRERPHKV